MTDLARHFVAYEQSRDVPNIVVDGSPNDATVLTLTHWPGFTQPSGTSVDTSAEMAFAYLDNPVPHAPAQAVTNNHFDQDGAVGIFALTQPDAALRHRALLVDLARAGDFGTYQHRDSARASMILNAFVDPDRSPVGSELSDDHDANTGVLYEAVLTQLPDIVTDPGRYRELWAAEDQSLTASEKAISQGKVTITEHADLDLAIVHVDDAEPERTGHRFGHMQLGPIHPIAVNNATRCSRLLLAHRQRFTYIDRYETWVQVHTHSPPQRVDMAPLAEALSSNDSQDVSWHAQDPGALTPIMRHDGESGLTLDDVVSQLRAHLASASPAWDPRPSV